MEYTPMSTIRAERMVSYIQRSLAEEIFQKQQVRITAIRRGLWILKKIQE